MLTNQEKNRYDRHIKLAEIGEEGQAKLKDAKVLVVGAGGLGSPVLQYLVAAGVGTIGVIDADKVSDSNLQRQILFTVNDVGRYKVDVAIERLRNQNSYVKFEGFNDWLSTENALTIFESYDIIIDGTDNFSTRYLINDACVLLDKPFVYASIFKFEGQLSVFNYEGGPSYRCLFPEPPKENQLPNCSEVGVLGVLPGVLGSLQANEVLKMILQMGTVLSGKLNVLNLLENSNYILKVNRNDDQITKVTNSGLLEDYNLFCGFQESVNLNEITLKEVVSLSENSDYAFLDVREEWEEPRINILKAIEVTLDELDEKFDLIPSDKKVIVFCQTGGRSLQAIRFLKENHGFNNLINLKDGVISFVV